MKKKEEEICKIISSEISDLHPSSILWLVTHLANNILWFHSHSKPLTNFSLTWENPPFFFWHHWQRTSVCTWMIMKCFHINTNVKSHRPSPRPTCSQEIRGRNKCEWGERGICNQWTLWVKFVFVLFFLFCYTCVS